MKTLAASLVAAAALTALTGCGQPAEAAPQQTAAPNITATPKPQTKSLKPPKPTTADTWNRIFSSRNVADAWAGGDVNVSATSRQGDVWWFYGDSILEPQSGSFTGVESTALMFPRGSEKARTVTYLDANGMTSRTLLPATGTTKMWPSAAIRNPKTPDQFILSASNINIAGQGQWGFQMVGSTLFNIALTGGQQPVAAITESVTTPQPLRTSPIQWGSALANDRRSIYIYGSQEVNGQFGKDIYLAVAPIATWSDTSTWRFNTDGGLTSNIDDATPILASDTGMPHTFSVTRHPAGKGWLLVAKQNEGIGQNVVALAARKPGGPWSEPTALFDAAPQDVLWQYMAIAHPAVPTPDGSLLVSTSQNVIADDALARLHKDPTLYRPQFYAVPLENLPAAR